MIEPIYNRTLDLLLVLKKYNPNRVQKIKKMSKAINNVKRLPKRKKSKNAIHEKYLEFESIE